MGAGIRNCSARVEHETAAPVEGLPTKPSPVTLVVKRTLQGTYRGMQAGLLVSCVASLPPYCVGVAALAITQILRMPFPTQRVLAIAKVAYSAIFAVTLSLGTIAGFLQGLSEVYGWALPSFNGVFGGDWDENMPDLLRVRPNPDPSPYSLSGPVENPHKPL